MHFPSNINPTSTLKLNNLLLVPSITKNLVSVSQFAKDNRVFFEFHANTCFMKCQTTSKVLLRGSLGGDGLDKFDSTPKFPSSQVLSVTKPKSSQQFRSSYIGPSLAFNIQCNNSCPNASTSSLYQIWHQKLGQHSHAVLKNLLQLCNIRIPNKKLIDFCNACCMGKVHRLPSAASIVVHTKPLKLNLKTQVTYSLNLTVDTHGFIP